jgi:hypothetical protein
MSSHPLSGDMMNDMMDDFPLECAGRRGDSSLFYGIYTSLHNVSLGIIRFSTTLIIRRLSSFQTKTHAGSTLLLIRDLLINQLKDTDAVVFDVRNNGGGSITLAESISQLFRINVESTSARYFLIFNFQGLSYLLSTKNYLQICRIERIGELRTF